MDNNVTTREFNEIFRSFSESINSSELTADEKTSIIVDFTMSMLPTLTTHGENLFASIDKDHPNLLPESRADLQENISGVIECLTAVADHGYLAQNPDRTRHATRLVVSRALEKAQNMLGVELGR